MLDARGPHGLAHPPQVENQHRFVPSRIPRTGYGSVPSPKKKTQKKVRFQRLKECMLGGHLWLLIL